jgi:hypothetical protein
MSSNYCRGKSKSGAPCRAPANSDGLCFFHANPERARALGQVGGRKNRHLLADPNGGPLSAIDLRNVLAQAILDVQTKKLPPRRAGAIARLSNTYCRLIPIADLEERVVRLEQYIAEHQRSVPNPGEAETNGTSSYADEGKRKRSSKTVQLFPIPPSPSIWTPRTEPTSPATGWLTGRTHSRWTLRNLPL